MLAAALCATASAAPPDTTSPSLTLDEAVAIALERSPRLAAEDARVHEVEAGLVGADVYPHNPELDFEGGARVGPDDTNFDFEVGLSQTFELGGQGSGRRDAARADVVAARSERRAAARLVSAEVQLAFVDALVARDLVAVSEAEATLAGRLHDLARRRLEEGAGTQLELNIAAAELGRAEQALGMVRGEFAATRAALAELLGLPNAALPVPAGPLAPDDRPLEPLDAIIAGAEANRVELEALRDRERAALARVELAEAAAIPDLRLGVFAGREDGTDTIIGASVGIALPFFDRNQGDVAEARASALRARADREVARLSIVREVVTTHERYRAGLASLAVLRDRVLGTTEENLELLQKAFEAGKTSWTDVLIMRRTLFDAQRALIETSAQVRRARVLLDLAVGATPIPAPATPEQTP